MDIEAEIRQIQRELAGIPSRWAGGGGSSAPETPYLVFSINYGNEIAASPVLVKGIKHITGEAIADKWMYERRRARAVCQVTGGAVTSAGISDPGASYAVGSPPYISVTPPPPGGTQAVLTCVVSDGSSLVAAKVTNCGSGYWQGAIATASAPPPGGSQIWLACTVSEGKVVAVTAAGVVAAGKGYTTPPTITITPAVTGVGSGATAEPIMSKGTVTSISIDTPGSGYVTAPTLTIDAPTWVFPTGNVGDYCADGLGWGSVLYANGGFSAGDLVRVVNDDRSMIPFALIFTATEGGVLRQGSDSCISWVETLVRFAGADPDAIGIMPCWVPCGGGQ